MAEWLRREKAQWEPSIQIFRRYAPLAIKTALIGMFLCHAQFLINGYTSPDGTNEGLFFYWNQRWALSIGRWGLEYLSESVANVVMPPIYLAFNGLCAAIAMMLWADLWQIRGRVTIVLGALSLVVAVSVTDQNLFIYFAYVYGFSMLMMVLAAYLVLTKRGFLSFLAAVLCLTLGSGGYQAYIGFATGTILLTLMVYCLQGRPLSEIGKKTGKVLAMGALGAVLYYLILQEELARYDVPLSDYKGMSSFSIGRVFRDLLPNIRMAYRDFLEYFTRGNIHLGKVMLVVLLGTIVLLGLWFLKLLRKNPLHAVILAALTMLLPVGINVIDILTGVEQNYLTIYPMQIIVPFALMLAEHEQGALWWRRLVRFGAGAAACAVCWLSVIIAYATYHTIGLAYKYVGTLTDAILTSVFTSGDYTPDTRVLIAGLPDESESQKFNFLRDITIYDKDFVFWPNATNGVLGNWKHYIYDYHGLWIGEVSTDEYYEILDSEEFSEMPVYPAEGSLQKFDDILVVKLEEDPPR